MPVWFIDEEDIGGDDKILKAYLYEIYLVRLLEILEMINFSGECRIKTGELIITLNEEDGFCTNARTETEGDEKTVFDGLNDKVLIQKITEINPLGEEIRLYTGNGPKTENRGNISSDEISGDPDESEITKKRDQTIENQAGKESDDLNALFEEELQNLDRDSIIKMKEKFRREIEEFAKEMIN